MILFLYEGVTEKEFYDALFEKKLKGKGIRMHKKNLEGNFNLSKKVINATDTFLTKNPDEKRVHLFVAIDREGDRSCESSLEVDFIHTQFDKKIIRSVNGIVVTQDIESCFFADIDGVFKFLRTENSKRKIDKYKNHEAFNNQDLSRLFKLNGKRYQKGKRTENLIQNLDLEKIYKRCPDLKDGIDLMIKLGV